MEVKNICDVTTINEMSDNTNIFVNDSGTLCQLSKTGLGGALFPVGSCYTTSTNSSPADYLGGTWQLIDKVFEEATLYDTEASNVLFTPTSYVDSYAIYAIRNGHSIRFRVGITPNIAFNDTAYELGTLNLEAFGITSFYASYIAIPFQGDGANGSVMLTIDTAGIVTANDVVKANISGQVLYANEVAVCRKNNMLDEACNQFIWKRVM